MGVHQAVQGQCECAREMKAICSRAPHIREEYLADSHRRALSRKKTAKTRSIERMITKERDCSRYRRMRCGVRKPRANPDTQVITTDSDGVQTTHEGKEVVQDACIKSIGKRYSQGNNSPFATGQLLEDLGCVGDGPRMGDVLEGKYEFPKNCPSEARVICEQARILHQEVAKDALNVVIRSDLFQRW